VAINDQVTHLHFVPRSPGTEMADAMDTDQTQDLANARYLVVGKLDFGTC
jgi:hypothetical protein